VGGLWHRRITKPFLCRPRRQAFSFEVWCTLPLVWREVIRCSRGGKLLTLLAVANKGNAIELTYKETLAHSQPFVLTITSGHISRQTCKPLSIRTSDLEAYALIYATEVRRTAKPRAFSPRSCGRGSELAGADLKSADRSLACSTVSSPRRAER
jgi:hypothetical protein